MSGDERRPGGGKERVSVEVEMRTWRADVRGARVTLYAVGEPARLALNEHGFLTLLVRTKQGEEAVEMDDLRGVLMVRSWPSPEQAELLVSAVEAGCPVEPRIVGDAWPGVEVWAEKDREEEGDDGPA